MPQIAITVALSSACIASAQPGQTPVPELAPFRAAASHAGGMDFTRGDGSLDITQAELWAILSRPLSPREGMLILPAFNYEFTSLDFSGSTPGFPAGDQDLHSFSLHSFFVQTFVDSPWLALAWTRAEMSTDFEHLTSDAFTFDAAFGVGYRFNDKFTLGAGAVVLNLNCDPSFFPGISFDWAISERLRAGLYGPQLLVRYAHDECWTFSLRGSPGGGDWNIRDADDRSRTIDLSSYRTGIYANRSIGRNLSIEAGIGMTFGNEIELKDPRGGNRVRRNLDTGGYGEIGLQLKSW
jgi:hypothetical protein